TQRREYFGDEAPGGTHRLNFGGGAQLDHRGGCPFGLPSILPDRTWACGAVAGRAVAESAPEAPAAAATGEHGRRSIEAWFCGAAFSSGSFRRPLCCRCGC